MKKIILSIITMAAFASFAADCCKNDVIGNIGSVKLKGYLGDRLNTMIERHVVARDVDYITQTFLAQPEREGWWWQTEFWGKWMHSAVPYTSYILNSDALMAKIEKSFERMLSAQEDCGYIGNYQNHRRCGEHWDVWGMKYTMLGLLHYYDLASRNASKSPAAKENAQRAINAAKKLCDYVIGEIGPNGNRKRQLWQTGNWAGYASSSILEPVVWLYKRTGEKKYLEFADFIVKGMSEPEAGPRLVDLALKGVSVADRNGHGNKPAKGNYYPSKVNRWKAYEMMSCYQGILDYVEVKRSLLNGAADARLDDLRKAAIMTAEDIIKEEVNLAGGAAASEAWFHGARKQHLPYVHLQETCVTTTWMRFCEKLLEQTDEPKWADCIEKTFYNAYLAALKSDGSEFAGYTPLSGNRWYGQHHCHMHTDCCTSNGPRGFLCFLNWLFLIRGDVATFNFYSSAFVEGNLSDGRKMAFEMYSLYPRTDYVRIVSHANCAAPVRLRIPAWSAKTVVKFNRKALDGVKAGSYFTINCEWKSGDVIEIIFDMPVVSHRMGYNVAFTRGPVLLARDSRFNDGDLMEPFRRGMQDGSVMTSFASVRVPTDNMWMAFSATLDIGSHSANPEGKLPSTVFFCDYASAGNEWARGNYYRTWFPVEYGPEE